MKRYFPFLFLATLTILGASSNIKADVVSYKKVSTPRFTLYVDKKIRSKEPLRTLRAKEKADISDFAISYLNKTYEELSRILKVSPKQKVVLRLLSPTQFKKYTGAPSWTNAMFFRGEITLPIHEHTTKHSGELHRALRHEYVHAVTAEVSSYRCPAWLDEGVAQILEGKVNPLLGPALRKWIAKNDAMPLDWLENGFTTLNHELVPAAYAQSLFATRDLVNRFGFPSVVNYLKLLGLEKSKEYAFRKAFGESRDKFEKGLTEKIKAWAKTDSIDP